MIRFWQKFTFIIVSTLILTACGAQSPSDVVQGKLNEFQQQGEAHIAELLGSETDEIDAQTTEMMKIYLDSLSFEILSETIDGDQAEVEVEVSGISLATVMGEVFKQSFGLALTNPNFDEDDIAPIWLEAMKAATPETHTGSLSLTKIDGEWQIDTLESLEQLITGLDL